MLHLILAAVLAISPSPSPAPVRTWQPIPHASEPPEAPEKIAHDLLELRITATNLFYGVIAPYCAKYGGLVSANPASEAQPYPVAVQCASKNLRIESPAVTSITQ